MSTDLKAEKTQTQMNTNNPVHKAAAVTVEALENRQLMSTYYIAPTGADSAAGSLAQPYATLNKALNVAKSGDTIILRGGTYAGNTVVNKANITIEGMDGENAKIVSPSNNSNIWFGISFGTEANHVTVKNLDISGGWYYAMKTETTRTNNTGTNHGASDLLFENCKFHDSGTHVIKLSPDTDRITFNNCELYNSGRRDPDQGQGMDAVNVDDMVMNNCYIHDTTQNAYFVKGGSQRCIIENSTIRNAGFGGILLGQDTDKASFDLTQNPNMYEAIDCIARNNIVDGTKYGGLEAWSSHGCQFINNWVQEAGQIGQAGIFISLNAWNKPNDNLTFQGNTIGVQADDELISIVPGAMKSGLSMSNQQYYGTDRIFDGQWQGTVAQWITHSGTDQGSKFVATGKPPAPTNPPPVDPPPVDPPPVDTTPGLAGVTITTTVNENGTATLAGTITNPGTGALTLMVNWGDGSAAQTFNLPAGATSFSQAHKYLDDSPTGTAQDNMNVTLSLRNNGTETDTASTTVKVKNVAPTMSGVSINSTIVEGGTATLAGSLSDVGTLDSYTLAIDWGDGSPVQNVALSAGTTNFSQNHKYADDNASDTYNVTVTLTDDDGGQATANKTIAVTNANPTLSNLLLTPIVANNGLATLTGVIGDAGAKDSFTLAVNWGDGSAIENVSLPAGTTSFTRTHTFVNPDTSDTQFTVGVTVTDKDGGSASGSKTVTVTNTVVPPALSGVTITSSVNEGANATLAGQINNAGANPLALAIDWGDGSGVQNVTLSAGATSFSVNHKYADNGTDNVGVTLMSAGVASSTASTSVTVKNAAPSLSNLAVSAPDSSGASTLTGVINDAGTGDSFTLTVNWGDGSDPQTLTFAAGTTNFSANHTYAASGLNGNGSTYPVSVTVTDKDGGSATASAGSVQVSGNGVLMIQGTAGDDVIDIQDTGSNIQVTVNGKATTYAYETVDSIQVDAGAGNDLVTIGDNVSDVYVYGGDGDDKLLDGDQGNTLSGGAGKDVMYGGAGDDRLNGNGGNDKLLGEVGNDRLRGGDGNDYVDGGSGNDRFWGGRGAQTMMGQGGNDRFYLKDGVVDMIFGGSGTDWADVDTTDQLASVETLAAAA